MRNQTSRRETCDVVQRGTCNPHGLGRLLCAAVFATTVLLALPAAVRAQQIVPCPPEQEEVVKVPEIAAQDGVLSGTVVLSDELQAMPSRQPPQMLPGDPNSKTVCQSQRVRMLRGVGPAAPPVPSTGTLPNPMPGPTLRARVGDIINLTFINQVNPGNFPGSIDNGERGLGCDRPVPPGDKFPDCFHGSSTGNIHFHGSHVNPNNTGDNVFIEVRPLPRDPQGKLTTTPEKVQEDLDKFFTQCRQMLAPSPLVPWPKSWIEDMPDGWTDRQKSLLQDYDRKLRDDYGPNAKMLWPVNAQQIKEGAWPQYYIGAFPYCFRIPEFPSTGAPGSPTHATHPASQPLPRGGAGTAELNVKGVTTPEQHNVSPMLKMGQAPGTHWYHAHKHGSTAINVANGMTGVFIIEGSYDDDLNLFYGPNWTRSQPVMVINQLGGTPNLLRGARNNQQGGITATDKGPDFSINGRMKPVITMKPNEVQMWRIVNTSGRAGTFFNTPDKTKMEWRQLAQDGVQFDEPNYQKRRNHSFLLASGNRADLLVQAKPCPNNTYPCTYPVIVQNEVDPSDLSAALPITLLSIRVTNDASVPTAGSDKGFIPQAPRRPGFLDDIKDDEVKGTKVITFGSTPPNLPGNPGSGSPPMAAQHSINGRKFDGEVGALVQLNMVEEWKIVNQTYGPPISHPFHIHVNPFQVTEIFDPNQTFNYAYTNPKTKKISTATGVAKYAFSEADLFQSTDANFQRAVRGLQCRLDPFAEGNTWKPCGPAFVNENNIWWDVFPIPSGKQITTAKDKIDPTTKKPVIDPNTGKPQKVVVSVPGYFKMRSRFVDYAGYYVLHCHILAHEDRGMMTVVQVSPATTPYSHH